MGNGIETVDLDLVVIEKKELEALLTAVVVYCMATSREDSCEFLEKIREMSLAVVNRIQAMFPGISFRIYDSIMKEFNAFKSNPS